MKFNSTLLATAFVVFALSAQTQAATISEWNLTGQPGTQIFTPILSDAANVTGSNIIRGTGIGGNAGLDSMNSAGWNNNPLDYLSFGFSVDTGYKVDLTTLFIGTRSSGFGPGTLGLYYNVDNYTSALFTFIQPGTNNLNSSIDLSTLPELSGNIEFRIFQIGTIAANGQATAATGTFRITDYFVGNVESSNLKFTGTVTSAVPVPAAFWLFGSALMGFVARNRRTA